MTPERFQQISHIFEQACRLEGAAVEAFLQLECGHDGELRREVEVLLAHDAAPLGFARGSSVGAGARVLAHELAEGSGPSLGRGAPRLERVGRCQVVRVIASGGMGTVFEAVQDHPRRTVALKVLRRGLTSPAALRRFEYEAEVLARLQHPNIAHIHEAGTHEEDGQPVPYFVMEYVPDARDIVTYAQGAQLDIRARLRLFMDVCAAVHHGHQKGIIHRDLKPANILVDGAGRPRIIDFGVARATDADVALTTQHTDVGQLVGTIQYMSPEQCLADPGDLDTRSDVYALGLVLYELLTGRRPYDVARLPLGAAIDTVRAARPERLSQHEPRLRGDVETIVHKALCKQREQRYASASELGRDIQRFLDGHAIAARPPSSTYQLGLLIRRHRALCGAVAAVFGVLVVGVIVSSVLYVRAERARINVVAAQQEAADRTAQAEVVTRFLTDMLASSNPMQRPGEDVRVRDVLQQAARDIESGFAGGPLVEATLRATIGRTYCALALPHEAEPHLRRALALRTAELGPDHLDVADTLADLAKLEYDLGNYADGLTAAERALEIRRARLGAAHVDTSDGLIRTATLLWALRRFDEAVAYAGEALDMRRALFDDRHPKVGDALHSYGLMLSASGDWRQAETMYREALVVHRHNYGDVHPKVATTLNNLAIIMRLDKQDYADAEALFREALAIRRATLGDHHEHTASTLRNLGSLLRFLEHYDEAEALIRESYEIRRDLLGPDHRYVLNSQSFLAGTLDARGAHDEALPLRREILELSLQRYGEHDVSVVHALHNLAWTLVGLGSYDEAEALYGRALDLARADLGNGDDATLTLLAHLTNLCVVQGRYADARAWASQELAARRLAAERPDAPAAAMLELAQALLACPVLDLRDPDEALAWTRRAASMSEPDETDVLSTLLRAARMTGDTAGAIEAGRGALAALPPEASPRREDIEEALGQALIDHGDVDAAEALYRQAWAHCAAELPAGHGLVTASQWRLASLLVDRARDDEAESLLRSARADALTAILPGHWQVARLDCELAAALCARDPADDDADALVDACAQLAGQGAAPARYRRHALRRRADCLEALGRDTDSAACRRQLAQQP